MEELTSKFVSNKVWGRYKKIITQFMDNDSARQKLVWAKSSQQLLSHGEDSRQLYYGVGIEALCYYNAFRNWPINQATLTGELDNENLSILISKNFIEKLGFLNSSGYWDFDWAKDRFIINGIVYRPDGDTQVAQAKDEALVFMVILKRDRDTDISTFIQGFLDIDGVLFCDKDGIPFTVYGHEMKIDVYQSLRDNEEINVLDDTDRQITVKEHKDTLAYNLIKDF